MKKKKSLPDVDYLLGKKGYIAGCTNKLFTSKQSWSDLVADTTEATIMQQPNPPSNSLKLKLSTSDKAFMNYILSEVESSPSEEWFVLLLFLPFLPFSLFSPFLSPFLFPPLSSSCLSLLSSPSSSLSPPSSFSLSRSFLFPPSLVCPVPFTLYLYSYPSSFPLSLWIFPPIYYSTSFLFCLFSSLLIHLLF